MNNIEGDQEIAIEGGRIEQVEEYVYLGQTISTKEGMEKEQKVRRAKAWKKFWTLSKMSIRSKIKILESCVIPVLSYGAETWALTKMQVDKLQKTQRSMERNILGIKIRDRVRNEEIRRETKNMDIGYKIKQQKFKFAGNLIRGSKMGKESNGVGTI